MKYIPEPFKGWLADLDKRIAEAEALVNTPLGSKEQRLARIRLNFLKQCRKQMFEMTQRKVIKLKPTK